MGPTLAIRRKGDEDYVLRRQCVRKEWWWQYQEDP